MRRDRMHARSHLANTSCTFPHGQCPSSVGGGGAVDGGAIVARAAARPSPFPPRASSVSPSFSSHSPCRWAWRGRRGTGSRTSRSWLLTLQRCGCDGSDDGDNEAAAASFLARRTHRRGELVALATSTQYAIARLLLAASRRRGRPVSIGPERGAHRRGSCTVGALAPRKLARTAGRVRRTAAPDSYEPSRRACAPQAALASWPAVPSAGHLPSSLKKRAGSNSLISAGGG